MNVIAKKSNNRFSASGVLINFWFVVISIICIVPMLYVLSISISSETEIVKWGYKLIPKKIDFIAYKILLSSPWQLINAYKISIAVTVFGTIFNLLVTSMVAFPLSRKDFKYRKQLSFYFFFTMLFNGGLVPWYILISNYLHMKNSLLVLILPYCANAGYILLMRSFMMTLPMELYQSVKIDGGSEFRIYISILLPLSKPALATVGLFYALIYWNDWWLGMLYIDNNNLVPLQLMLNRIMMSIEYLSKNLRFARMATTKLSNLPNESTRMAVCALAAGPMLFVFPFFQKYFVKGLIVGSLKG